MSSFDEKQATALLKERPIEFVNYNKHQLSRVYPGMCERKAIFCNFLLSATLRPLPLLQLDTVSTAPTSCRNCSGIAAVSLWL